MGFKSLVEHERKSFQKMKQYQLPNKAKVYGLALFILGLITVLVNGFVWDNEIIRIASKYVILIGLLIISISKEKVEDERIARLRMMSYTIAFIVGVFWSLIFPFVNLGVDSVVQGSATFEDTGDFFILWMLLAVQVMFFEKSKRL